VQKEDGRATGRAYLGENPAEAGLDYLALKSKDVRFAHKGGNPPTLGRFNKKGRPEERPFLFLQA
jgi:hypothetical protein